MKIKLIFIMSLLVASIMFLGCTPEGNQGEWLDIKHDHDQQYQVRAIGSFYWISPEEKYLVVVYQVTNTGKAPLDFDWTNKLVIDQEGRKFTPINGERSGNVQPLEKSEPLRVEYSLPPAVNLNTLWWGLAHEGKFRYKIKLNPMRGVE